MRSSPLRHPARVAGTSLLRLQSDERLAELAIAGHEAAFDAIVVRYRAAIQRYCAGIVGPSRAEDATQQTLINAHDALTRTDEVRHLRSWLYRIAHNVSLNVLRAVRDEIPLEAVSSTPSAIGDGPAESFERSERFRATVAALQELPERQRAALVLRELEGRSHAEIADALGVTKGSARQHLMRARVTVRSAVTAITPFPLIARLADAVSGPGSAGWADAAAGVGVGATMAKLTAGVVVTGALVGGAVGTERAVVHRSASAQTRAQEDAAAKRAVAAMAAKSSAVAAAPVVAASPTSTGALARRTADDRAHPGDATTRTPTTPRGQSDAGAGAGGSSTPTAHGGQGADDRSSSSASQRRDTASARRQHKAKKGSRSSGKAKAKPKAEVKPQSESTAAKAKEHASGQTGAGEDTTPAPTPAVETMPDATETGSGSAGSLETPDATPDSALHSGPNGGARNS
ncbi:MAG TPA: sigma-70 family RNA polymerase sigma factor [Baekduia sp.]|nr:sigma-70 family RNA polymerase sigma factor [Baekduia sp.]